MRTDKTAVALRVLSAINNRQQPEERDLVLLRAYCPDTRNLSPDEMACIVIQETVGPGRKGQAERSSDAHASN